MDSAAAVRKNLAKRSMVLLLKSVDEKEIGPVYAATS
jgi:hypothetical protein